MVLSELYEYINRSPVPSDAASACYTHEYLEACNQLFENGLLSHAKVCDIQGDVLVSIWKGYKYFEKWHDDLYGL